MRRLLLRALLLGTLMPHARSRACPESCHHPSMDPDCAGCTPPPFEGSLVSRSSSRIAAARGGLRRRPRSQGFRGRRARGAQSQQLHGRRGDGPLYRRRERMPRELRDLPVCAPRPRAPEVDQLSAALSAAAATTGFAGAVAAVAAADATVASQTAGSATAAAAAAAAARRAAPGAADGHGGRSVRPLRPLRPVVQLPLGKLPPR
eukprot:6702598-Prymnesium_polylepis.1